MGPTAAGGVRYARSTTCEKGDAPQRGSDTTPDHPDEEQNGGQAP